MPLIFAPMNWFAARAFLWHYFRARRRGHNVHSPFVYALCREVFMKKNTLINHPAELYRSQLLADQSLISVLDFGTGKNGPRKISAIASGSAKSREAGQLLYRIVQRFRPEHMLEIGTSLGITSLYEVHPGMKKFISLEGCPETASRARQRLQQEGVEIITGEFSASLPQVLQQFSKLDYVYFDGNHRREPTLKYFEACLPLAHNETVFVFDDIHWSAEMESAWMNICADSRVTVTIDLFHFGLVFFRKEQVKENFVIWA